MTAFVRGRPVKTAEPGVVVDAGLGVGTHRFQLVVVTRDGRQSPPDLVDVVVTRAVVGPVRPSVTEPVSPVRPTLTAVVSPRVTPRAAPLRTPATPRKSKPRKPAKPRSEK
jgi:hypothetical protein